MNKYFSNFILFLFLQLAVTPVFADSSSAQAEAQSIFSTVLSPFCPGRLLQDCPSGKAKDLRDNIELRLEQGEAKESIIESLYNTYGDDIRALPRDNWLGLLAWITPAIFLLLGFSIIIIWQKKSSRNKVQDPPIEKLSTSDQERLTSELAKLK